jgi:hypothetical protein
LPGHRDTRQEGDQNTGHEADDFGLHLNLRDTASRPCGPAKPETLGERLPRIDPVYCK